MLRSQIWIPVVLVASVAACGKGDVPSDANDHAPGDTNVLVIKPDAHDVSPPLAELARRPVPFVSERVHEAEPWRRIPHKQIEAAGPVADPVVQSALGGPDIPTPITTFEGMGAGLAGFQIQLAPPDTDGDIGPNHYVQIVNVSVTIFSRTGAVLLGPVNTNTLWNGFNGACATTDDGDGVVRYDRMADRWVISQFSVNATNGPFFQCVAVSTTPDPTGTYNRYQFSFDGFNDYPKMGLWPDAYYFTFNMFPNNTFAGARLCAFDRAKMLTGAAATEQCFNTSSSIGGLLASDLDGSTLPPAGSPNFAVAINTTTSLAFFKTHIDFTTPANSTFSGPTSITVPSFAELCSGGTCVKQPGTQQLDSLADRLMNRAVYRRFADHDAMLVAHSVTAGTGGGIRWYELRDMATTPTVFQSGTYAPDSSFRWMPSMTFDQTGGIATCFSVSSPTINPSIHYTGRLASDALGTMGQGEGTIITGSGAQNGNLSRWGDYASINIDPTDDCTFWCTHEYMGASGSFNWHTRVGKFTLPCAVTNFSITVNPTSQTVAAGSSTTYTVSTAVTAGAAQPMNLSVSGLPAGVTGSFNPASVTAGGSSTLTLTVAASTGAGTTSFTITGTGTSATHTTNASVTINKPPTVSITSPANGSTLSGMITVSANASDPDGTIASVKFDLPDGTSVTGITAPFSTTFDTTKVVNGSYTIRATATDNQGATAVATVTVTVANNKPPTISITSPAGGSTVSKTITVSANASDPDGTIANVKFGLPDGTTVTTTAPFSTTFDTTKVANGSRVFTATATDNQGATTTAAPVTVTVANNKPPTVSITSPADGSTVSGTITVSANASDPDGTIKSVTFDLPDGTSVTTTSPFSTTFDTTKVANGSYTIRATATDNQDATDIATATVTVHNCPDSTFSAKDIPSPIRDNDPLGVTSSIEVTGNGDVGSLSLSLDIAHPFRSDLMVTLISPAGTQFSVSSRQGDSQDNLVIGDQAITAFDGEALAGVWQLTVRDLAKGDAGTLNSWSLKVRDSCSPTAR